MDLTKKESKYINIPGPVNWIKYLLGFLFVVFGTGFLATESRMAALFFYLLGITAFLVGEGTQVDIGLRRVRVYISYFGFMTGKWWPLDNFKCIVVSDVTLRTKSGTVVETRIFLSSVNIYKQPSMILGSDRDRASAIQHANEIGRQLKLEVKINKPS